MRHFWWRLRAWLTRGEESAIIAGDLRPRDVGNASTVGATVKAPLLLAIQPKGLQRSFPRRLAACDVQRRCRVSPGWMAIWLAQIASPSSDFIAKCCLNPPLPRKAFTRMQKRKEEEACCVGERRSLLCGRKKKSCGKFASFVIFFK